MTNRGVVSISGSTLGRGGRRPQAADPLGSNDITNRRYVDTRVAAAPSYALPSNGTAPPNRFDFLRSFYNIKAGNTRRLDEGLGRCQYGGQSEHVFIGDSLTAGQNNTTTVAVFDRLNALPLAFRNALSAMGIPGNGTGMIRLVDGSYIDSRCVYTGTWTTSSGTSAGSSVLSSTVTISPDRSGTYIDVIYYDYASGSAQFTVKLDGVTVNTTTVSGTNQGAVGGAGTGWKIVRIPNLAVVANFSQIVITVTAIGNSVGVLLGGVDVWSPAAGLRVHNIAQSGSTASGSGVNCWSDTTTNNAPQVVFATTGGATRQVTNAGSTSASNVLTSATAAFTSADVGKPVDIVPGGSGAMFPQNAYISGFTSATQVTLSYVVNGVVTNANAYQTLTNQTVKIGRVPDCIHIALGVNDIATLLATPATVTAAITTIRNLYPNSDCILHLTPDPNPAIVATPTWTAWQLALYQLADTLDVPLLDWRDQVGTYANGQSLGWYGDTLTHLSSATYSMMGSALAASLGPGAGRNQVTSSQAPLNDNDVVPKWYLDQRRTTTATAAALTTVETVILQLKVPANTLKVGSTIRYSGMLSPAATTITTTRVRIGTAGTTADAALNVMSATATTSSATRYVEGTASVQVVGASGTFLGIGTETVGAVTASGTQIATSGTFDTTKNLYITLTVANGTTTTTTMKSGFLELIP